MAYSSDTTENVTTNNDPIAIGNSASNFISFHGATPCIQASHIADIGNSADSTAIATAVNAIIVALKNKGWTALS